ncbi:MAG: hypothetical protein ACPGQS_09890, partial [Bradymonadia bacterium]
MMLTRQGICLTLLFIAVSQWASATPEKSIDASKKPDQTDRRTEEHNEFKDTFDLIYFGNTHGVSAHQSINHLHRLDSPKSTYVYQARGPYAYVCDRFIIAREGPLTIADFEQALTRFLSPTAPEPVVEVVPGFISPFHFVMTTTPSAKLPNLDPSFRPYSWTSKHLSQMTGIRLFYPQEISFNEFSTRCSKSSAWQVRYAAHGLRSEPPRSIITIRRPLGDGIARTQEINAVLDRGNIHEPLIISAGNNFEGLSFLRPNTPDQQRKNTRRSLALVQTHVLMIGDTEAMFDNQDVQIRHEASHVAQIRPLELYRKRQGQHEIVVLNLNPGSMQQENFLESVKNKVDSIRRSSEQSFIIGIGILNKVYQTRLLNSDVGLDLLIGDFDGTPYVPKEMSLNVTTPIVHPLQVPSVGRTSWGHLRLKFNGRHVQLNHRTFPVLSRFGGLLNPHVEQLMHEVNRTRHRAFREKQIRFIAQLPERYSRSDGWRELCLLALQEHLSTDIAILPKFPVAWSINNPVLKLTAIANLPISAKASILTFDGKALQKLIKSQVMTPLMVTGLELTSQKVGGRSISTRRWYTLATTRSLADRFAKLVPPISRHDVGEAVTTTSTESGTYIQSMILETMPNTLHRIVQRSQSIKKVPEWFLDFDRVTLEGSQLHRLGAPENYNDVPEPRLTTQDYTQVAARGRVTLGFDSDSMTSLNYIDAAFAKSYLDQGPPQETDDRLELGTEFIINRSKHV